MNYRSNPALRLRRFPEYWDYRRPRSAQEYLDNNARRRRNVGRRVTAFLQRLLVCAVGVFVLALLL